MRYASTNRSVVGAKGAVYRPAIQLAGNYEVFAAWGAATNRRNPIAYTVTGTGSPTKIPVDQSVVDNTWVSLGTYPFAVGTSGNVRMTNEDVDLSGSFYAGPVKFVYMPPANVKNWEMY
jgi:hypothetical protein